ncbi:MAG: response regulator [Nitrososphaeraceae archaeon]|nr:response regulator [Nitrososphaeraceae archaeon]
MESAKKILIVDDDIDSNPSLKLVLEENGFKVDVFKDPLLALENLQPNFYDLLIIDTNMSKVNGLALYDEIKRIDNKARVCFLTASQTCV